MDSIDVLKTLGADPVNMPMADVYSALAKGVIDGVVAPADSLRSMHLAEVGRYFTRLAIPRGAYPARAISHAALQRLAPDLQRLLLASGAFWESSVGTRNQASTGRWQRLWAAARRAIHLTAGD
jgi:TRAP-type C4-dicarboxylate transport system substrate-binding protein